MIVLKNEVLTMTIDEVGAELVSVIDNASGYEYMWQPNPKYWNRTAPVLFPIVGALKNNQYEYDGKTYELPPHGFARDKVFKTQTVTDNSATFYLKNDEETMKQYPFEFSFQITYILFENKISVSYEILNPSKTETLWYSVGGHPGFNVSHHRPKKGQPEFQNVSYHLAPAESHLYIPITKKGIDPYYSKFSDTRHIDVLHKVFKRDAMIYRIPKRAAVILKDPNNGVEITLRMLNMEYLGIWSSYPKKAGFVCLEPWAGLGDIVRGNGQLVDKQGIQALPPSDIRMHDYTIEFQKDNN